MMCLLGCFTFGSEEVLLSRGTSYMMCLSGCFTFGSEEVLLRRRTSYVMFARKSNM